VFELVFVFVFAFAFAFGAAAPAGALSVTSPTGPSGGSVVG
jgi:hypothetical protein